MKTRYPEDEEFATVENDLLYHKKQIENLFAELRKKFDVPEGYTWSIFPDRVELVPISVEEEPMGKLKNMSQVHRETQQSQQVKAQGMFDLFKVMDKQTLNRIKQIIAAVDPKKVQQVFDAIKMENGRVKIDVTLMLGS